MAGLDWDTLYIERLHTELEGSIVSEWVPKYLLYYDCDFNDKKGKKEQEEEGFEARREKNLGDEE